MQRDKRVARTDHRLPDQHDLSCPVLMQGTTSMANKQQLLADQN